MATHSSILAWRIPWTEEPRRLQSMGLQRVRQNGATNTILYKVSYFYPAVGLKPIHINCLTPQFKAEIFR